MALSGPARVGRVSGQVKESGLSPGNVDNAHYSTRRLPESCYGSTRAAYASPYTHRQAGAGTSNGEANSSPPCASGTMFIVVTML